MTTTILTHIQAHSRPDELRVIEVPEWGEPGAPLVIKFKLVSIDDLSLMQRVTKSFGTNSNSGERSASSWERAIWLLMRKARAADGETYLFPDMKDGEILRHSADPDVVLRTAARMLGSGSSAPTALDDAAVVPAPAQPPTSFD